MVKLPIKIPSKQATEYKQIAQEFIEYYTPLDTVKLEIEGMLSDNKKIYSNAFGRTIQYRVYLPSTAYITKKIPAIYIVDGQQYLEETTIVEQTDLLIRSNKIKPLALIFIDSRDIENLSINHRHEYLICNPAMLRFVEDELLTSIEAQYPVTNKAEERTILGHSLGGLFTAYMGFKKPYLFQNIGMQSPWFEACPPIYKAYEKESNNFLKMYMSFGTGKDTQQQDLPMIRTLYSKGYFLKVNQVEGADHTWELWRNEIEDILIHFYKK